jgi:hypothetical protein
LQRQTNVGTSVKNRVLKDFDLSPSAHHFVGVSGRRVSDGLLRLNSPDPISSVSAAPPAASDGRREAVAVVGVVVVDEVDVVRTVNEVLTGMKGGCRRHNLDQILQNFFVRNLRIFAIS